MYRIKIYYQTGDSFSSQDEEDYITYYDSCENRTKVFLLSDIDIAKENLKRIQEHYKWASEDYNSYSYKFGDAFTAKQKEEWSKIEDYRKKYQYAETVWLLNMPEFMAIPMKSKQIDVMRLQNYVNLLRDDGSELNVSAFWVGYFETLYGAEIECEQPDGWSFRL